MGFDPAHPPPRRVRVRSLAKINLDLRVLHKRQDGYHELRTIFQTISLADTIDLEFTPADRTHIGLDSEIDIPNNLILRAAELVLEASGTTGQLHFRLDKRIPMGGGLGGGSSNAAAVLLALPVLTGRPLPLDKLLELGAQLGSDVPFLLFGGAAVGIGRGNELYPCFDPPQQPVLLITPGLHVSTPEAYRGLARELTPEAPSGIIGSFQSLVWGVGAGGGCEPVNDFETVVFSQHPQLKTLKGKLLELGASSALMSGSGSTVFGIFANRGRRDEAVVCLENELGKEQVHAVSMVNRNRYRAMWWRQLRAHMADKAWPPRSRYRT